VYKAVSRLYAGVKARPGEAEAVHVDPDSAVYGGHVGKKHELGCVAVYAT
jgi:hypothetical protein